MTAPIKKLYLAIDTGGVVEYEGPASLDDVREILANDGFTVLPRTGWLAPLSDECKAALKVDGSFPIPKPTFGTQKMDLGGSTINFGKAPEALYLTEEKAKETNGSNGHGDAGELPLQGGIPAGYAVGSGVRMQTENGHGEAREAERPARIDADKVVFSNPWPDQPKRIGRDGPPECLELTVDDIADAVAKRLVDRKGERKKPSERIDEIKAERLERMGTPGAQFAPMLEDVVAFLDEQEER